MIAEKSAQPCGCDPGCGPHGWICERHTNESIERAMTEKRAEGFTIKDSGERRQFASGMQRDVTTGKVDYSLVLDGPMFERWAVHLTKGAEKYDKRNWMKAEGAEELARFRESALRHFLQWFRGDTDEDHASAVLFNINGAEYVKGRQASTCANCGKSGNIAAGSDLCYSCA